MRRTALTRPATPPTLAVEKRSEPACQATLPRAMACRWRADGVQMARRWHADGVAAIHSVPAVYV